MMLIHCEEVCILYRKMHNLLVVASKETGLEVNVD